MFWHFPGTLAFPVAALAFSEHIYILVTQFPAYFKETGLS